MPAWLVRACTRARRSPVGTTSATPSKSNLTHISHLNRPTTHGNGAGDLQIPSGQQNLARPPKLAHSLAGMRRDDEVRARGLLGKDFVDGDPIVGRQFAHSLDDPEVVAVETKETETKKTIVTQTRQGEGGRTSSEAVDQRNETTQTPKESEARP